MEIKQKIHRLGYRFSLGFFRKSQTFGKSLKTSDFDKIISMCGIKFWKAYENLRPVYKKTVFRNVERFLAFLTFKFSESIHCPFLEMKTFFFRNSFSQKTVLPIEKLTKSQKNLFLGQNFLCVHFLLRSNVHFWN